MADEVKTVTVTIDGRELTLRQASDDQIMAWMGLAGGLKELADDEDRDNDILIEDVTLLLDAILGMFTTDADRRHFRRAVVLGRAKITDAFSALISGEDVKVAAPKPKVRRAGAR